MDDLINKVLSYFWEKFVSLFLWLVKTLLVPFHWVLDGIFWVFSRVAYFIFDVF